jgi:hypothetical protein
MQLFQQIPGTGSLVSMEPDVSSHHQAEETEGIYKLEGGETSQAVRSLVMTNSAT